MLPLECNPTEERTVDEVYAAARKACSALAVVQSRTQALIFEARCDIERAKEYAMELWQEGWGELQPVTELPKLGKDKIKAAITKAFARYKAVTLDIYSLRGPVARASIQAEKSPSTEMDQFELDLEIERQLE